jgi:undecaprenyl diphosphate synthase
VEIGIKYLTLYTFSTENWNRPKLEIEGLMTLLVSTIHSETKTLMDNNVQLYTIGNINAMPPKVAEKLRDAISLTSKNTGMKLILALSYSSRWELTEAVRQIVSDTEAGKLKTEQITSDIISKHLQTSDFPDPELLIRTSGEYRVSNFLLWQIAYTELYFTDLLWPEFDTESLYEALYNYQCRERRFGKTSEQLIGN